MLLESQLGGALVGEPGHGIGSECENHNIYIHVYIKITRTVLSYQTALPKHGQPQHTFRAIYIPYSRINTCKRFVFKDPSPFEGHQPGASLFEAVTGILTGRFMVQYLAFSDLWKHFSI